MPHGNDTGSGGSDAALADLLALIDRLRGKGGCPWDQRQTPETMRKYLLEESRELAEAIESGDEAAVREESGDLLFVLAFLIRLYEERGAFTWAGVCAGVRDKMVRRHPHVFGPDAGIARSEDELRAQWAAIKAGERRDREAADSADAAASAGAGFPLTPPGGPE